MTTTSAITVNAILNRAAAEMGLDTNVDPFASTEKHFIQMRYLLQTLGEELALAYPWEFLNEAHQITTSSADSGDYDLPTDFHYMIPQTNWDHSNELPMGGPLNAQDWTYLQGRNLANTTIYASYRLREGKFSVFPQPPPDALDLNFEYQRTTWLIPSDDADAFASEIAGGGDTVLYDRTLITRGLKVKFLEAKGFDTTKAGQDFGQAFDFLTSKDKSGEILNAGTGNSMFPYLDVYRNAPITGYGI